MLAPEPLPAAAPGAPRRRPLAAAVGGCRRLHAGRRHLRGRSGRPARRTPRRRRSPAAPRRRCVEAPMPPGVGARADGAGSRRSSADGRMIRDRAARPLPGGAQAVRRHLGARRALRPSCAARRSTPSRAETTARRLSHAVALARSARSGLRGDRGRAGGVARSRRPGAADGAAERSARLAAAHPRCRQPAQLPGHVRGQRRRRRRQRPDLALLRRPEPVRAHRVARRPGSARCSATTTSCTPSGRRSRWR